MKLPTEKISTAFNTFTLAGISMLWGQMLGLVNPWFTPVTILTIIIGYGSEIRLKQED